MISNSACKKRPLPLGFVTDRIRTSKTGLMRAGSILASPQAFEVSHLCRDPSLRIPLLQTSDTTMDFEDSFGALPFFSKVSLYNRVFIDCSSLNGAMCILTSIGKNKTL